MILWVHFLSLEYVKQYRRIMKLSLGMIFKDEVKQFERIVNDYGKLFDEIVIAVDYNFNEFKAIANANPNIKIKILPYVWQNDFSHKRNFVAHHITGDLYMRLDADDAINYNSIKNVRNIAENAFTNGIDIVFGYYNYSRDQWGNVNAAHWREVIIKSTPNLYWNKKIHENVLPKNKNKYQIDMNEGLIIEHLSDEKHIEQSLLRNIKYLLEEYNQDKEKTDSRTLSYLGRMLHGMGEFDKAIFFLEKHIQTSGWDEDRFMSWCQLSDCYRLKGNNEQAIAAAFEALSERPDYPDAYLKLHDIYFAQENWQKAEIWGRQGLLKPVPKTFMMQDLSAYGWRPILSLAFTLFQLSKYEEALKLFNIAKKDVPSLDFIKENEKMFIKAVEHKKFMENYLAVLNYLKEKDEESKIPSLLKAAPKDLNENELILKLKHHYIEPVEWSNKSVCIFAMNTLNDWSPKSVDNGIGGSEEAVIYMTKELAKLGLDVTVFNNCGEDKGIYDGVTYKNVSEFNPNDIYNVLISWRSNIFENNVYAKKRIVWLHDIPNIDFSDDNIKKVDNIVVLSQYHADMIPINVPREKIFISTNGVNEDDFKGLENVSREPFRCIYASSYNRGLEQLLEIWPEVKKQIPEASLHIYYGWDTYDAFVRQGHTKDNGFKARLEALMTQEGVFHHGRLGHKELLVEYAKSSIFSYPCSYSGEINCIALTKAISTGCIAVTNDFAVMAERNPYPAVHQDKFKDLLINTLKNQDIRNIVNKEEYLKDNSWTAVAIDWKDRLFKINHPIIYTGRRDWIQSNCYKDAKIVDIGCNKGHLFEGWDRTNITSVDIDKYDLPNFIRADASKALPFSDKQFDIAVMGEIIEHLDNPVDAVREGMRIAKKLIITIPWEERWTSDLLPFATIEERMKLERVDSRAELVAIANPAVEFHSEDNYEHIYHKQFFTAENFRDILNKADISDYKLVELRDGNWVNIGVVCG